MYVIPRKRQKLRKKKTWQFSQIFDESQVFPMNALSSGNTFNADEVIAAKFFSHLTFVVYDIYLCLVCTGYHRVGYSPLYEYLIS